jgi:ribosomal protein S18 acetylase RimI-like enzyme
MVTLPAEAYAVAVIRNLQKADTDECDRIIASLGDWFGNEEGIRQASNAVRSQSGLVIDDAMSVVGFATWVKHSEEAAEITWMAVHRQHRHEGHGSALIAQLCSILRDEGVSLLSVKTLGSDSGDPWYAETRAFYEAHGFRPLMELPDLWDQENPCLVMVRVLDALHTGGELRLTSIDENDRGDTAGKADRRVVDGAEKPIPDAAT